MSIRRRRLRVLALGLTFALLAAQWALATYSCPMEQRGIAMAAMRAAGLPCDEVNTHQPALCHQHLAQAALSSAMTAPLLPTLHELTLAGNAPAALVEGVPGHAAEGLLGAAQGPPSAPVYLATLRLRN
jgi:hypothetical protein